MSVNVTNPNPRGSNVDNVSGKTVNGQVVLTVVPIYHDDAVLYVPVRAEVAHELCF